MTSLNSIRNYLEQLKGKKQQIELTIQTLQKGIKKGKYEYRLYEKALEIIKLVGIKTQQQLQYHISGVASLALDAVFENAYELKIEFVERRNKTECDIYFEREGKRLDPLSSSGGGTIDIAAFALRIASWSMMNPKTNNVFILDEPIKNVSPEFKEKASLMLKEVSEKLGVQFIIINHEPILTEHADKVFKMDIIKGVSKIEEL